MGDVQYRLARREDLSLIDVMSLPVGMPTEERPRNLTCAGCGRPVRPRLGNKRPRHFYHPRSATDHVCSGETYLHQAGKKALAEAMEALIATGRPLTLFHPAAVVHRRYGWDGRLRATEFEKADLRVPTRGATVEVERGELGFVADVRMRCGADTLFLEVAVTHPCSPKKVATGIPILEFDIRCEGDIGEMVERVRSGTLQVGGGNAVARTFNLGLGVIRKHLDEPTREELHRSADEVLRGLFRPGQNVRLRDGTWRVVPRRRARLDGGREPGVIAATEAEIPDLFREALETYDSGLIALLPTEPGRAAELIRRHRSGEGRWVPELIPMSPFTPLGGLDPAIPDRIRDRISADGTVDGWRDRFGIVERAVPAAPVPQPDAPRPAAAASGPARTRDLTFSVSRQGRISATPDGRVFGALVGTFPIELSRPDVWALDQVMRGRLGRAGFVRSCLGCRHHAFSHDAKKPIFCFRNRASCHQTEAVTCEGWSPIRGEAELVAHRRRVAESPKAPPLARLMAG